MKTYKNYIYLILAFMVLSLGTYLFVKIYNHYYEYRYSIPEIKDVKVIDIQEFNQISVEIPNSLYLFSASNNESNREFERNFNGVVSKHKLQNLLIYVNIKKINTTIAKEIEEKFNIVIKNNTPIIAAIYNGKVTNVIYSKNGSFNNKELSDMLNIIKGKIEYNA